MGEPRQWMIYGANGYTGQLVAELAKSRGLVPVLAGRSAEKLKSLSERLGFPTRIFSLDASDSETAKRALEGIGAVLHCAGPFSQTSAPMVDACLAAGAHYLDVTGEMSVIAAVLARSAEAKSRGVALLPAVGFDVVPSDCLALALKEKLPAATALELAFAGGQNSSPGTMKTAVEALPEGGFIRRGGKLLRVPAAEMVRSIPFHDRARECMSVPWGDLVSAYASTGIPDITIYMSAPPSLIRAARLSRFGAPLLRIGPVLRFVQARIAARVKGPTAEERARTKSEFWGRVTAPDGSSAEGTLTVPEGYTLTADAALECTLRTLRGEVVPGAHTPAQAFGSSFIAKLSGTTLRV